MTLSSEEMLKDMVKELYYGEAIKIVTENQGSLIEPLPENPRPIDRLNTWGHRNARGWTFERD